MAADAAVGGQRLEGTTVEQTPSLGLLGREDELGALSRTVDDLSNGVRSHRSRPASPRSITARSGASARPNRTTRGIDRGVADATQLDARKPLRNNDLRR
jgi:hypothetical protein